MNEDKEQKNHNMGWVKALQTLEDAGIVKPPRQVSKNYSDRYIGFFRTEKVRFRIDARITDFYGVYGAPQCELIYVPVEQYCPDCKKWLRIEHFAPNDSCPIGYYPHCKPCASMRNKINKEKKQTEKAKKTEGKTQQNYEKKSPTMLDLLLLNVPAEHREAVLHDLQRDINEKAAQHEKLLKFDGRSADNNLEQSSQQEGR